ncbi:MAG: AmmeMemoRadiSam system protein A, partial [Vicinamibacteria bacterium]|nr:AmmeMemoRadiSam system protein A [Vicinamibacteria bacterium]
MSALNREQQASLLELARRAIETREGVARLTAGAPGELLRRQGAFVSLHTRKTRELRGCIGFVEGLYPLAETVARVARAAAYEDPRFAPVTPDEFAELHVEISVMSPLERIRPEDVVVGVHGLLIKRGQRQGLLLPQVATEYGWDRETFLEHTCIKARLAGDAWRSPESELYGFSAQVFGE